MARPRIRLLIPNDPHPMRIERDLAKEIGLNESIVLLQLEYLISISNNERDGRLWTYQTLQDLHEVYFPWWSVMTISRIVKALEEKELIIIGNYNKLGYDRTQWYALNDVGIAKLTSVLMHSDAIYHNDKSISQNGKSIYQIDMIDSNKMINGTQQNDTTIPKITHEITQGSGMEETQVEQPTRPLSELAIAIAEVCKINPKVATAKQKRDLNATYKALKSIGATPADVQAREEWWYANDWRAKKEGRAPRPDELQSIWEEAAAPVKKPSVNGTNPPAADLPLVRASPKKTPEEQRAAAERRKAILEETKRTGK
jgi:hypothetical protein